MNYQAIYARLMERAKSRTLPAGTYVERHHIRPRCMSGGDDPENIAVLTGQEHALAHMLLVKMFPANRKLVFAAQLMLANTHGLRHGSKSKSYGWLKERAIEARRGVQPTDETRQKLSEGYNHEHNEKRAKLAAEAIAKRTPEERAETSAKLWDTRRKNGTTRLSDEHKKKFHEGRKNYGSLPPEVEKARAKKASATRIENGKLGKYADFFTPEKCTSRSLKAWETKRVRGTDKKPPETKARMSDAQVKRAADETPEKREARLKALEAARAASIITRARNKALKEAENPAIIAETA